MASTTPPAPRNISIIWVSMAPINYLFSSVSLTLTIIYFTFLALSIPGAGGPCVGIGTLRFAISAQLFAPIWVFGSVGFWFYMATRAWSRSLIKVQIWASSWPIAIWKYAHIAWLTSSNFVFLVVLKIFSIPMYFVVADVTSVGRRVSVARLCSPKAPPKAIPFSPSYTGTVLVFVSYLLFSNASAPIILLMAKKF